MGKAFWHDCTTASTLQCIVTNFGCRVHGFFDVTLLQDLPLALRVMRPHPGKTVGL